MNEGTSTAKALPTPATPPPRKSTEKITGYIQNTSPIRNLTKQPYFDFYIQTGEQPVRGVCFSPQKRKLFVDADEKKVPVEIKKFVHGEDPSSTDILMGDNVVLKVIGESDVPFIRKELVPTNLNISMLTSIAVGQEITIKGKVIALQNPEQVGNSSEPLTKAEGWLVDPFGSIKIVLWEDDIAKVQNGTTYRFENLRLRKNPKSGEIYVNPSKSGSSIVPTTAFTEPVAIHEVPKELLDDNITAEIIGIVTAQVDITCIRCNRRIKTTGAQNIVTCDNATCGIKQKLAKCKSQWFVKALVESENSTTTLLFRNDEISNAMKLVNSDINIKEISQEALTDHFLSLPKLDITYTKRSKVVTSVTVSSSA